ncbi:hypothetical protein [Corallococcus sicarius]|uniref:Uncharacterized protein n=1 Tax=Corallococcus sicarius TaxID=2316726 RepID=A0A3A8NT74_9BACT|nr:hypothetical protein [Corallococcus sicarius]RKH47596.1 hypothetical protein D7X12_02530 [Corallococcus sicarius]
MDPAAAARRDEAARQKAAEDARRAAEAARKAAEAARKAAEEARRAAEAARQQKAAAEKAAADAKKAAQKPDQTPEAAKKSKADADAADKTRQQATDKAAAADKKLQAAEEKAALDAKRAQDAMGKANALATREKQTPPFTQRDIDKVKPKPNELASAFEGTNRKAELEKLLGTAAPPKTKAVQTPAAKGGAKSSHLEDGVAPPARDYSRLGIAGPQGAAQPASLDGEPPPSLEMEAPQGTRSTPDLIPTPSPSPGPTVPQPTPTGEPPPTAPPTTPSTPPAPTSPPPTPPQPLSTEKPTTRPPKDGPAKPPKDAPTGAEAAARLKVPMRYVGFLGQGHRASEYLDTIRAHQNDPAYLKDLYKGLGDKDTEALFKDASRHVADSPGTAGEQTDALKVLARSTHQLPPAVADKLAKDAAALDSRSPLTPVLKQPETSESIRRTVLDTAAAAFKESPSVVDAQKFGDVLASDPKLIQDYATSLGRDRFTGILAKGFEHPPFGFGRNSQGPTRMDGLGKVLGQASELFKGPAYADLRANIFRVGANSLGDSTDPARATQLDGLKKHFKADALDIIDQLSNNTTRAGSAFDGTGKGLANFLRDTLVSDPQKDPGFAKFLKQELPGQLHRLVTDPNTLKGNNGQQSPNEKYARILGSYTGSLATGYLQAIKASNDKQELIGRAVDSFTGTILHKAGMVGEAVKPSIEKALTDLLTRGEADYQKQLRQFLVGVLNQATRGLQDFDTKAGENTDTESKFRLGFNSILELNEFLDAI